MTIHHVSQRPPPNPGRRDNSSIKNQVIQDDEEVIDGDDDDGCTYCSNSTLYINQDFHDDQDNSSNNNNTAVIPGNDLGGSSNDNYYGGGWPKTNPDVGDGGCCSDTTTNPPYHHQNPTGTATTHTQLSPQSFQPIDLIHSCLVVAFILLNVLLIYCFMTSYHTHQYPADESGRISPRKQKRRKRQLDKELRYKIWGSEDDTIYVGSTSRETDSKSEEDDEEGSGLRLTSIRKRLGGRRVRRRRLGGIRRGAATTSNSRRRGRILRQQNDTIVSDSIAFNCENGEGCEAVPHGALAASPAVEDCDHSSSMMPTVVQLESNSNSTIIFVPDDDDGEDNVVNAIINENDDSSTKEDIHRCDEDDGNDNNDSNGENAVVAVDHSTSRRGDHDSGDKDDGVSNEVNNDDSQSVVLDINHNFSASSNDIGIHGEAPTEDEGNHGNDDEEVNSVVSSSSSSSSRSMAFSCSSFAFSNQAPSCAICMDEFVNGDYVCIPSNERCQHNFHLSCMKDWLVLHKRCPICREVYLDKATTTASPSPTSTRAGDALGSSRSLRAAETATASIPNAPTNSEPSVKTNVAVAVAVGASEPPARLSRGLEESEASEATKTEVPSDALDDLV